MRFEITTIFAILALGAACTPTDSGSTETDPTGTTGDTTAVDPTTSEATTIEATTIEATTVEATTIEATTADTTTTDTTTDGDTTAGETAGGFSEELAEGCGFPRPCQEVRLNCGDDQWFNQCTAAYSPETQCVLERLAAGEAFALRFDLNGHYGEEEWFDIVFDGEGGAVRQNWVEDPVTFQAAASGPPEQCVLISAEMFAACLAAPNDEPLHAECMFVYNWFASCEAAPAATCPQP